MRDKIFFDTNILIYSISQKSDKREKARLLIKSDSELFLSTQVINEFNNVCIKKGLLPLEKITEIIDSFYNIFHITILNKFQIESALDLVLKYNFQYWDSLIVASALKEDCSILYSEDMQHGQIIENSLKIINPFV